MSDIDSNKLLRSIYNLYITSKCEDMLPNNIYDGIYLT